MANNFYSAPETDDAEETMEEMEMAPPPPPPPPPQPMMIAPVKLPVQTMIHTPIAATAAPMPQQLQQQPMVRYEFFTGTVADVNINVFFLRSKQRRLQVGKGECHLLNHQLKIFLHHPR